MCFRNHWYSTLIEPTNFKRKVWWRTLSYHNFEAQENHSQIPKVFYTTYTSKWPKTAVTEIGSGDLICIQTSKWPKYFSLSFWPILRFELQNGPFNRYRKLEFVHSGSKFEAILKFEWISSHLTLSLSQQFRAILRYISYWKRIATGGAGVAVIISVGKFILPIFSATFSMFSM